MKKIILFLIFSIFLFAFSYSYTSCITHNRVDKSLEVCNNIIESIQIGENIVDKEIIGYEKVDELLNILKDRKELPINLSEYFSNIINTNNFSDRIKEDRPNITEEELNDIYKKVFGNSDSFIEEETIFVDKNGNKCIKLKDLRRLDNGDGVIKYFNGEYIIDKKYIPLFYNELQRDNKFNFTFFDYIKDKNLFVFVNDNNDFLYIIYNMRENIISDVFLEYK